MKKKKRTDPFDQVDGRMVSRAEYDRQQKRYDISKWTNQQKCAVIRVLTEFPQLMGYWRFTNKAIWVNLDAIWESQEVRDGLAGLLKTLDDYRP